MGSRQRSDRGQCLAYDSLRLAVGKAAPYGVYDVAANEAFVNVGQNHDTAEFALARIQGWWDAMGWERYPEETRLYIKSDRRGSNAAVSRLYKMAVPRLYKPSSDVVS